MKFHPATTTICGVIKNGPFEKKTRYVVTASWDKISVERFSPSFRIRKK